MFYDNVVDIDYVLSGVEEEEEDNQYRHYETSEGGD